MDRAIYLDDIIFHNYLSDLISIWVCIQIISAYLISFITDLASLTWSSPGFLCLIKGDDVCVNGVLSVASDTLLLISLVSALLLSRSLMRFSCLLIQISHRLAITASSAMVITKTLSKKSTIILEKFLSHIWYSSPTSPTVMARGERNVSQW